MNSTDDLCDLVTSNNCDNITCSDVTMHCVPTNTSFLCKCKDGFQGWLHNHMLCTTEDLPRTYYVLYHTCINGFTTINIYYVKH